MAAVYGSKQSKQESESCENDKDSCPEINTDPPICDKVLGVEHGGGVGERGGGGVGAGVCAPEAREHTGVCEVKIKEEPMEESEYVTVHVEDEDCEDQSGHFSDQQEHNEDDWPVCCEEKSESFHNKNQTYVDHRREHGHDGPIVCLDTDSEWDNLLVSTDGGRQTLCCALCGCKFSNSREFFTHQLKHRKKTRGEKEESLLETAAAGSSKQKVFECNDCGKTYSSIGQCLNHQRSHKQASKSVFHQLAHLKKKSFQCSTCGRSYSRASALDAHRRCHEEKLFKSRSSDGEKHLSDEVKTEVKTEVNVEDIADTSSEQLEESPKKRFECLDCGKSFRTMSGLGTHQRFAVNCSSNTVKVRPKRSYECTECGKTFHRPMAMSCHQRWHRRREQLQGNEQPFRCAECGRVFTSLTFYNKHQRLAHSQELPAKSFLYQVIQLQKKAFECQECGCRFSRASALHSHQLCHTDVFGDLMEGSTQNLLSQNSPGRASHFGGHAHSQDIAQTNVSIKQLQRVGTFSAAGDSKPVVIDASDRHSDQASQQNPDLELVCESDQEEKDLCKETVQQSPPRPVDPEIGVKIVQVDCVNSNEQSGNAGMQQSPSQEANFECPVCNRTFEKAVALRCHILCHRGGKKKKSRFGRKRNTANPFRKASMICEICGHESYTKSSHYVHLGKHEERKPYKSTTYQLSNLQKHSFACDLCGLNFSRLSSLQSHQKQHGVKKPYECSQCDKRYSKLSTLYNHRKVCTGAASSPSDKVRKAEQFNPSKTLLGPKVHHCKKCGKGFWSVGAFIQHKEYHPQCADTTNSSTDTNKPEKGQGCKNQDNTRDGHDRTPGATTGRVKSSLYKCDVCDKSYRVIGCFLKHKLLHQNQGIPLPVKASGDQVKQVGNQKHICPDCGKRFSRAKALQFHMRSHGYETGLPVLNKTNTSTGPQCPGCHVVFTCESSLEVHQKQCVKAKGKRVEMSQENESDNPNAPKENVREQANAKGTSENVLQMPPFTSDLQYRRDDAGQSFPVVGILNLHKSIRRKDRIAMASLSEYADMSLSEPEEPTSKGSFHCTECGRKFSTNSALGTHRRWHKDKTLAKFILKSSKMSRKNMENGPYLCNLCGKGFFYLCVLRRHQKYHPPIVAQPDPELNHKIAEHLGANCPMRLACPKCDESFTSGSLLTAHFDSHHAKQVHAIPLGEQVLGQTVKPVTDPTHLAVGGDKPKINFFCVPCDKKFVNARGLRAHKWQKHRNARGRPPASMNGGVKPFPCSQCEKSYRSYASLLIHERFCNVNSLSLRQPDKPDVVEEQPSRPLEYGTKCLFKCCNCAKAFPSQKQLDSHKEAARSRPHCCTLCCRGYWTEAQLQQHLIWHDEVRRRLPTELRYRLNSSVVSASSAKLQDSSAHLSQSPGKLPSTAVNLQLERNYKCHQCSKTFVSPHALEEHRALHKSEPYQCSQCPKTFAELKDLIDHHQECLGDKEFQGTPAPSRDTESLTCIECGISFDQETDLHQHYIDHARGAF